MFKTPPLRLVDKLMLQGNSSGCRMHRMKESCITLSTYKSWPSEIVAHFDNVSADAQDAD